MTAEPTVSPQPALSFDDAFKKALQDRGIKPKCSPCGSIGWANLAVGVGVIFNIHGHPIQIGLLICQKCAHVKQYMLGDLGLQLKQEQRQVLTASEIAAQQKQPGLIVAP